MAESDRGDVEYQLTQLYTRKLTRKAFQMIADDYKKQTNKDLCELLAEAQKEIIRDIVNTPVGRKGADVRTRLFKLTDYSTLIRYCPTKK